MDEIPKDGTELEGAHLSPNIKLDKPYSIIKGTPPWNIK